MSKLHKTKWPGAPSHDPKKAGHSKRAKRIQKNPPLSPQPPVQMPTEAVDVAIDFCGDVSGLGEVRAALRKLEHPRCFIASVLDERDKQLYPRDLLVARLPSKKQRKEGGGRPAGILRRSLKYDKERGSHIVVDFVWVAKEFRRMGIGRKLLVAGLVDGRDKPVRLLVAGSEENYKAVGLYESLGFRWTCSLKTDMQLRKEQVAAAVGRKDESALAAEQQAAAATDAATADAVVDTSDAASPVLVAAVTSEQADETGVGPAAADANSEGSVATRRVKELVEPAEPEEDEGEDEDDGQCERLAERTSVTRPEERTSRTGDEELSRPASPAVGCELPTVHEPVALEVGIEVR